MPKQSAFKAEIPRLENRKKLEMSASRSSQDLYPSTLAFWDLEGFSGFFESLSAPLGFHAGFPAAL